MANSSLCSSLLLPNLIFLLILIFLLFLSSPQPPNSLAVQSQPCNIRNLETDAAKCDFLLYSGHCSPKGYINYLHLYYCFFGHRHTLGLAVLLLWLILLFYLLGSTAATYFCSNLEGLSRLLRLSPAIAGAKLLSLGNSAPDVFSSIASFEGGGAACNFGLNSVLGGALFVSAVVVGVVGVVAAPTKVAVEKLNFVRDACFFLFVLLSLTVILVAGEISVWIAMAFALLYLIYILLVYLTHRFGGTLIAIKHLLELPLNLPRRLTIPDISEDRWSKPFAVTSATTSPLLLATLSSPNQFLVGAFLGLFTGVAAFFTTESQNPPTRFRLPWLAGGFLMSVTWTYVTAKELVSLLVSIGTVIGISPALLGSTVLAWGDSLGDLMAATAMAVGGGEGGVQVAVSGCYAGPTFNVLVGLGVPMGMSAWAAWPAPAVVEVDSGVFETVAFLAGGVMWALVILPRRGMRPDRFLGCGLIAVYLCFLAVKLATSYGHLSL